MRKFIGLAAVLITLALPSALAQNSSVGTWRYDAAASDFGSQPKPKSIHLVITKDSAAMLAWHLTEVSADGKTGTRSWSGPKDGTMHPLKTSTGTGQASFKGDENEMTINEKTPDGMTGEAHITKSDNGDTMTEHFTGTDKSGNQATETIVWHRLKHAAKKAAAK